MSSEKEESDANQRNLRMSLEYRDGSDDDDDDDDEDSDYGEDCEDKDNESDDGVGGKGGRRNFHKHRVESARKFLWDEDDDDDEMIAISPAARPMVVNSRASFLRAPHQEIDLEGHLGVSRHCEIVETKRAGLFRRPPASSSRSSSDRLGLYDYGRTQKHNPILEFFAGVFQCIYSNIVFCFGYLFCTRNIKRNIIVYIGFTAVILLIAGVVAGVNNNGSSSGRAPAFVPKPSDEVSPEDQKRLSEFKNVIIQNSYVSEDVLTDPLMPQHTAWQWIATADPAQLSPTDPFMISRYVLATLYFATSGYHHMKLPGEETLEEPWPLQTNWLSAKGYCSWHGVECMTNTGKNQNAEIVSLNLTSNVLVGRLPSEVTFLSHLDTLDLSNNMLGDHFPSQFGLMTNLQTLMLQKNEFSGSVATEIGSMTMLRYLDLSENDIFGQLPDELNKCTSLRALIFDKNLFLKSLPTSLAGLKALEVLSFEKCELQGSFPEYIYGLTSLRELDLRKNNLSGGISSQLSKLSQLESLELSQNSFSGTIPEIFSHLKQLRTVNFMDNELNGIIPSSLTELTGLELLFLDSNKFSGPIPVSIGKLANLKELFLQRNNLSGAIPDVFHDMKNLEVLDIKFNKLVGTIPMSLSQCSNLIRLKIDNNELTNPIPTELAKLTKLEDFNLFHNQFTGSFPNEVCVLRDGTLDHLEADCKQDKLVCECCTNCF